MHRRIRYIALLVALTACDFTRSEHVKSSAGAAFTAPSHRLGDYDPGDRVYTEAVRDSAAHDIPCPQESIRVQSVRGPHFVADGCGTRVVYECPSRYASHASHAFDTECQMILVNRLEVPPS